MRPSPTTRPRTVSLEEMIRRAEARPPFRVPGLIHSALTGISGEPFVGKSSLATHLVVSALTGSEFLGVSWETPPDRVLLALTDPGAVEEYGDRFKAARLTAGALQTHEGPVPPGAWAALRAEGAFPLTDRSLVVVDTLTGCLPDLNSAADAHVFFGELSAELCAYGVSVVVLMHQSEKRGKDGYRSLTPMGTTSISAHIRHRLTLTRHGDGGVRITTAGNQAADDLDITAVQGDHAADWRVQSMANFVRRSKATMDRNAGAADFVITECQGLNKKDTGQRLAKRFGGTAGSWTKRLQPKGPVGRLVLLEGATWVPAA